MSSTNTLRRSYSGVRRRKWGKWVSEIRVPGTQERLWLGSYSTPEGAAVAHDIAVYCLRRPASLDRLNFPALLPAGLRADMSLMSVQKAASDAGMAIDAQFIMQRATEEEVARSPSSGSCGCSGNDSFMTVYGDEGFTTAEETDYDHHHHQYCSTGSRGVVPSLSISVEDYDYYM
ncbi:hypothetical protein SAY87_020823 [Trapa incisa]|uniref:AP2/ERF domain-containing protein n=1 Tax=Trapa incisa TaxID=236973 RepID=A0AAN7JQC4_9MYRT|nr:hypothetical protein SAY87_020823 [Trapa incisa]